MTVTITLTLAGSDTGPFNLYSDSDGYTNAFQTGIAKSVLVAGLTTATVPDDTSIIRVTSEGVCQNHIDLSITGNTTTTTTSTTSTTSSTTSSTTTLNPDNHNLAEIASNAEALSGCSLGTILRIFLNNTDYALFVANGNSFAGLGGGAVTTCTAIALDHLGSPITAYLFDNDGICWELTTGHFRYNNHQC
jgi:hypothetical protein